MISFPQLISAKLSVTHLFCKVKYTWNMILYNYFFTELFRTVTLNKYQRASTDHLLGADYILSALHVLIHLCYILFPSLPISFPFSRLMSLKTVTFKKQPKSEMGVVSIVHLTYGAFHQELGDLAKQYQEIPWMGAEVT